MEFSIERNDARNFLEEHSLGTLATLRGDGIPELAVVYFFTEHDFSCYFITKVLTRKYKNISVGPRATLLSYDEKIMTSVEVTGVIEILLEPLAIARAIEKFHDVVLSRHQDGYWIPPISQISAGQYVVCKIVPHIVRYCHYKTARDDTDVTGCHMFTLT